jgi:hypothetical protein
MTTLRKLTLCVLAALALVACQNKAPAVVPEKLLFSELETRASESEGLFNFYRLNDTGELYLEVRKDQLEQDFLHLVTAQDGLAVNWTMRGGYLGKRVLRLREDFDKLVIEQVNTQHYFDPESALSRAAAANLPPSVLAIADITDKSEEGDLLVKVDPVFLSEALHQIRSAADPKAEPGTQFNLGELSEGKTRLKEVRGYPDNVDLLVNYVYEEAAPLVSGGPGQTDPRVTVMLIQHSFVKLPDNNFQPRFEDPRVGYFTDRVTDQTSHSATPYRDPIQRWNLEKKNPEQAISEPLQPIVFWLENTTPYEYREVIREAVLTWNQAFESAGFRNAIVVEIQPDDADWDAADIRYNVLRWTASDESPWGGYGPRFSDPRTGQIVGADIMLEHRWITRHMEDDRDFSEALLPASLSDASQVPGCQLGRYKQTQMMVARALLAVNASTVAESELVRQSIFDLVTHEVGHTLGLNHNFIASYYLSPQQLAEVDTTLEKGVSASVMDYLSINFSPVGQPQADYYPLKPGPYDHWAIEYGYSEALRDGMAERQRLDALLANSTKPGLAFGHDADDMRSSRSGIDPRFMIFDQSSDPVAYAAQRVELIESLMPQLRDKIATENKSWQELFDAYLNLTGEWARQMTVASRWIGGVHVDRSFQGQSGAQLPLIPVARERQLAAVALLGDKLFAPEALQFDQSLYPYLQRQRRGFDLWSQAQDPKLLDRGLAVQKSVLGHLLNPVTLSRISDSELYGNGYPLTEFMADLRRAIFDADIESTVSPRRQQLQREYIGMLLQIVDHEADNNYGYLSKSSSYYQLQVQQNALASRPMTDEATQAHTLALLNHIESVLDAD